MLPKAKLAFQFKFSSQQRGNKLLCVFYLSSNGAVLGLSLIKHVQLSHPGRSQHSRPFTDCINEDSSEELQQ